MNEKRSLILFWTLSVGCVVLVSAALFFYFRGVSQSHVQQAGKVPGKPEIRMIYMPPYPKTITVRNFFDNTEKAIPIEDFAGGDQVVFLNSGKEVPKQWMADKIAWIYTEEILPLGKDGEKVPIEKAVKLVIKQYGKDNELLRDRTIDKTESSKLTEPQKNQPVK